MKNCPLHNQETYCTDNCKDCARECHRDLKAEAGKSEMVSEEALLDRFTEEEIRLMKQYGFIECCGIVGNRKMYAI